MEKNKCLLEEIGKYSVEEIVNFIGKKWVISILKELSAGKSRFNELLRSIKGISPGILSNRLNKMGKNGIINRKVYAEVPPRVEYSLTEKGRDLKDVIVSIEEWYMKWE